jgi:DNA end-binding protein Ku
MAKALVGNLASEWDPAKYTDQYRENLMRTIQAKLKGKEVVLKADVEPRQADVIDLMERLRRSLEQSAPRRGRASGKGGKPKAPARGRVEVAQKRAPHAA